MKAVPAPLAFWQKVVRLHVSPLYRHPALVPKDSDSLSGAEVACHDPDDGSITNGDDHVWLGDSDMLIDGAWRDFELDIHVMLGKRPRSTMSSSVGDVSSPSVEQDMEVVDKHLDREGSELEDDGCFC